MHAVVRAFFSGMLQANNMACLHKQDAWGRRSHLYCKIQMSQKCML